MRREWQAAAAAVVVLLILAGSIYIEEPQLLTGGSKSTGATTSASTALSMSPSVAATSQSSGAASSSAAGVDWTTYHGDNARTGYMATSNFTSVTSGWTSPTLDGEIYAEPLVYGGDVFVATENNSVYALDAQNGSILWRTNLGAPVAGDQLQCGDIDPSGITGTPVIDPSTGTLYVVSFWEQTFSHTLSALNVSTGAIVFQRAADFPGFDVTTQQQRSALSLANGMVYIPYGGLDGDCGQYYGWVVGIPANGTGSMSVYKVRVTREGGIWAPSGAAVDASGNVFVTTGNGASVTAYDHGDSVIELSPSLSEEGYFAPTNWSVLNQEDQDLGSVGPMMVGQDQLFQIGKQGVGYLLNSSDLGGIGGQTFESDVCNGGYGGTAYSSPYIFVPCLDGLFALKVADGAFTTAWRSSSFFAGPPIVTGGVVWTVDLSSATLLGYGVGSGHQVDSFPLGGVERFTGPAAGDGQLFVATTDAVMSFVLG